MTGGDLLRLVQQLQRHEGSGPMRAGRFLPYQDTVGKWTIGFGRNLTDRGISHDEADVLLANDVDLAADDARRNFPWFATLDSVRQAAIVNLVFNMGVTRVLGFEHALAFMAAGEYAKAADAFAQSKWRAQVGARAVELCQQIRTGKWAV